MANLTLIQSPKTRVRGIFPQDLPALVAAMSELDMTVAGMSGGMALRSIAKAGLSHHEVTVLIRECDGDIGGFLFCISNWRQFWFKFLLARPIFLIRVLAARVLTTRLFSPPVALPTDVRSDGKSTTEKISWKDSGPKISKTLFVGVREKHRGLGIGRSLYLEMFKELQRKGVSRLDAKIDLKNESSRRLHASAQFEVIKIDGNGIFVSRQINADSDPYATV